MKKMFHAAAGLLLLSTINPQLSICHAQGTAFTYQGQLQNNGSPASGTYAMTFALFNTNATGAAIAGPVTNNAVSVTNGLFTTMIDFGAGVFTGGTNWLQIGVATNGAGSFAPLSPRQQLTPVPYAITAANLSGSVLASSISGTIPLAQLPAVLVTNGASGISVAGFFNGSFGGSFYGDGGGLTDLNPANLGAGTAAINISGNAATATTAVNLTGVNGTNIFAGVVIATNVNNVLAGSFTGDGGGLANLNASQLTSIGNADSVLGDNFFVGPAGNSTTTGAANTAIGWDALATNTSGNYNTANGYGALYNNTTGGENTANGLTALFRNTAGLFNTANGIQALYSNTNGTGNTADGGGALYANTSGSFNTADGLYALLENTSGSNNIALGYQAGYYITTGASNIDIGNLGLATDTNIIRIGSGQTQSYLAGVINGNGGGLTSLNAGNITTGTLPLAQLPAAAVTNGESGVSIGGTNVVAQLTIPPSFPTQAVGTASFGSEDTTPLGIAVAGRTVYVLGTGDFFENVFEVVDVSNPGTPQIIDTYFPSLASPNCVAAAGRYLYYTDPGNHVFGVLDASDPASLLPAGSLTLSSAPEFVVSAGRYAYVVDNASNMYVIDASRPASPSLVSTTSTGAASVPSSLAVAGRYAYVANTGLTNLQIVDLNNPSSPVLAGAAVTGATPEAVAVSGRYAYVVCSGAQNVEIFDVSNPSSPNKVGTVTIGGGARWIAVAGRYAYVANSGGTSTQIIDVGNPANPLLVDSISTPGNGPGAVAVSGRYLYVNNNLELQIYDLGGAYIQQMEAGTIETGTLQTRDNVVVGNNLDIRSGLTVNGSARISGGLSVDNGNITATNFSGNGGGLTNLNAAQLNGSVPSGVSVPAANLTGALPAISGASLTSLPAGSLTGVLPAINGVNLTNLSASQLTSIGLGIGNFFLGSAGNATTSGQYNTGSGLNALASNTSGNDNTATGSGALHANTSGSDNTAIGLNALHVNTTGSNNVAVGSGALFSNASGSNNIAIGFNAGDAITTTSSNIDIGNTGVATDSNIIRIGTAQAATYLVGNVYTPSGSVEMGSDRNIKENFTTINPLDVLARVAALPVSKWNYKTDKTMEHLGPMAQDFQAAFGLNGTDDKHISVIDEGGVALAAIQGLNQKLDEKDAEIQALKQQNDSLAERLNELEATVKQLAANK